MIGISGMIVLTRVKVWWAELSGSVRSSRTQSYWLDSSWEFASSNDIAVSTSKSIASTCLRWELMSLVTTLLSSTRRTEIFIVGEKLIGGDFQS